MHEFSPCVLEGFQVSAVFLDPVCRREVCTPRQDVRQTDLLFQHCSLPRGLGVLCLSGSEGAGFAVSF
jgi:hypothetical protein